MNRVDRHSWLQGKKLEFEIAERRRAEAKALSASRAKGEFLAVMSHEIRTPLSSILAMSEILSTDKGLQDERSRRQLDILNVAGRHLNELINDILDFSRMEAHHKSIASGPFALRETVDKAIASVRNLAMKKGLTLSAGVDADTPDLFLGDPQRIRQVLINLVGNAIKFTAHGGVGVQVHYSGERLHFSISDTGIGIAEEDLERIFEPFQQSDSSSTREYQGTGLGLTISHNLVKQMGGRISARNRPAGGAIFEFELALPIADRETSAAASSQHQIEVPAPAEGFRALVVEDSELNRMVIEEYLADVRCEIQFAPDGRGGVDAYENGKFDIVLMDLQMPEMDGITASRRMREWELRQGLARTPIVIISADSRVDTQEAAKDAGADGYITKPMSKAELFSALATHFPADSTSPGEPRQGNTVLSPLLPRYFEQMEHDIEAMSRAVSTEDIEKLQALAHAVKGHSQMFGFAELAKAAGDLEDLAETDASMTPDLRAAWEKLRELCAETTALRRTTG